MLPQALLNVNSTRLGHEHARPLTLTLTLTLTLVLHVQATVVGFGEEGALLHVDVAGSDGRPVTLTAFAPLSELSWSPVQSAHDAVKVRKS